MAAVYMLNHSLSSSWDLASSSRHIKLIQAYKLKYLKANECFCSKWENANEKTVLVKVVWSFHNFPKVQTVQVFEYLHANLC